MPNTRKRGNGKKVIGILIGILVLFAGIGVFAFQKHFLNSPIIQYADAEKKTIDMINNVTRKYSEKQNTLEEKLANETSRTTTSISADFDIKHDGQSDPIMTLVRGVLGNSELKVDTYLNPSELETAIDFDLVLQGMSLFNASLYQNDLYTSIESPIIYDQALALQNDQLGSFFAKQGEPALLEEIPNFIELQQGTLTNEELKALIGEYVAYVWDELKNIEVNIDENANYDGKKYTLYSIHISNEEAKQILSKLLTKVRDDERIERLLYAPFNVPTEDNVFDVMIEGLEHIDFPDGISYEAYYNHDFVAHRKLIMSIASFGETVDFDLSIDTVITKNNEYELQTDLIFESSNLSYFFIRFDSVGEPQNDDYRVERKLSIGYEDIYESGSIHFNFDTDYKGSVAHTEFSLFADMNDPSFPNISGHFSDDLTINENVATQTSDFSIAVEAYNEFSDVLEEVWLTFTVNQDYQFGGNIDSPRINQHDVIWLNELEHDELMELIKDIEQHISTYYEQYFGGFLPF